MGVDYNVYIGPYVKIYNPLKDSFDEYFGCNNSLCKKYLDHISTSKFCSECGNQIVVVKKPTKRPTKVNFYDLLDENLIPVLHHYRSEPDEYNYLIPNKAFNIRATHYDPHCFEGIVDFNPGDILSESALFETLNKRWIEILQRTFGQKNVVIKWGTIFYAN